MIIIAKDDKFLPLIFKSEWMYLNVYGEFPTFLTRKAIISH